MCLKRACACSRGCGDVACARTCVRGTTRTLTLKRQQHDRIACRPATTGAMPLAPRQHRCAVALCSGRARRTAMHGRLLKGRHLMQAVQQSPRSPLGKTTLPPWPASCPLNCSNPAARVSQPSRTAANRYAPGIQDCNSLAALDGPLYGSCFNFAGIVTHSEAAPFATENVMRLQMTRKPKVEVSHKVQHSAHS